MRSKICNAISASLAQTSPMKSTHRHVLTFHRNATITTLDTRRLPLSELGFVTKERASHIRPEGIGKRLAFIALRRIFGDDGCVAAWTRTWPGPWRCHIIGTDLIFVDEHRDVCLVWEHAELNQ